MTTPRRFAGALRHSNAETLAEHNENVALLREWQAQQSAEPTEP